MDDAGPEVGMHDIYLCIQDFQSWGINSESDLLQRMDHYLPTPKQINCRHYHLRIIESTIKTKFKEERDL